MSRLVHHLLGLSGTPVYLIVGLMVFAEDALFVGFLVPGETAAILGGVAASRGHASLPVLCVVVVIAAVAADTVGYLVGTRFGARLLSTRLLRSHRERIDAARDFLSRRGGPAVFLGRFIAFLHAVMPFLAGSAHMPYRRFVAYNWTGAVVWGVGSVVLGYLAGNSYVAIERALGRGGALAAAAIVVAALVAWSVRRHLRRARGSEAP